MALNRTQGSSNFSGVTSCGTSGARTCNIQRGQQDQNRVNKIYPPKSNIDTQHKYPTWTGDTFAKPPLWVSIEAFGYLSLALGSVIFTHILCNDIC